MTSISATGKQALDDFVAKTVEEKKIPAFAIGLSSVDEELYFNAGGYRVCDDPESGDVTPDSVFWICSMTKLIAAIAALQLIEQGKLGFDVPVSKYLPEFENTVVLQDPYTSLSPTFKPAEGEVTIFHLLSHSSGLFYGLRPGNPPWGLPAAYAAVYDEGDRSHKQFFDHLKGAYPSIPLVFEPGSTFCYGLSSDVLGFVVEKVTGQSLGEYCRKNIFDPLNLGTTFDLDAESRKRLIEMSFRNPDGSVSRWANQTVLLQGFPKPATVHFGGVGAYSSLRDYLTLLRHLLQIEAGRNVSNPILKVETVKSLFQPRLSPAGAQALSSMVKMLDPNPNLDHLNWSTGLAVTTQDWPGQRKAGSAFWSGWAGTCFFMDPTTGIALVFGVQVVPALDPEVIKFGDKVEEIVYSHLQSQN